MTDPNPMDQNIFAGSGNKIYSSDLDPNLFGYFKIGVARHFWVGADRTRSNPMKSGIRIRNKSVADVDHWESTNFTLNFNIDGLINTNRT